MPIAETRCRHRTNCSAPVPFGQTQRVAGHGRGFLEERRRRALCALWRSRLPPGLPAAERNRSRNVLRTAARTDGPADRGVQTGPRARADDAVSRLTSRIYT